MSVCHRTCWPAGATYFSISGAQCTKSWLQNLKAGFLMSSMKVMSKPQGCGLFTISLSSRTLKKQVRGVQVNVRGCVCVCVSE